MIDDLSPTAVVKWMRAQATRFGEMADEIESTFSARSALGTTTERVRELLGDGKARRPRTIANNLGIKEASVFGVLSQAGSGLSRNGRGWVTLSPKAPDDPPTEEFGGGCLPLDNPTAVSQPSGDEPGSSRPSQ